MKKKMKKKAWKEWVAFKISDRFWWTSCGCSHFSFFFFFFLPCHWLFQRVVPEVGLCLICNLLKKRKKVNVSGACCPVELILKLIWPQVDIFSFSMVIYEILTGHPPFEKCGRLHQIHHIINNEKRRPSLKVTPPYAASANFYSKEFAAICLLWQMHSFLWGRQCIY